VKRAGDEAERRGNWAKKRIEPKNNRRIRKALLIYRFEV
jgi:hypothetical protein